MVDLKKPDKNILKNFLQIFLPSVISTNFWEVSVAQLGSLGAPCSPVALPIGVHRGRPKIFWLFCILYSSKKSMLLSILLNRCCCQFCHNMTLRHKVIWCYYSYKQILYNNMILFCWQGSNFCHQLFFNMHQYELKQKWMIIMQF